MSNKQPNAKYKRCPYCKEVFKSSGLHTHVMNSSDDLHGDFREIPDDFDSSQAEVVQPSQFNTGTQKRTKENELYYCHWCEKLTRGERGLKIHLGKARGDEDHPDDASIEDDQYSIVPADKDWNPLMDMEDIEFLSQRWSDKRDGLNVGRETPAEPEESDGYNLPDKPKTEQVAALLKQEPSLYHDPEEVRDVVGCSRTTYYEGRRLYDAVHGQDESSK